MAGASHLLTSQEIADIEKPLGTARTLPRRAFFDPSFYDFEVERLLSHTWIAVAFADAVPNVGDASPLTILGRPLFLVRSESNRIRAFHNVVPYDGCEALIRDRKGLSEIVTPYHGLTYDLHGKLTRAAFWNGTEDGADIGALDCDLVPIHCEIWFGTVFVNLDNAAIPFREYLAPVTAFYADYGLENLAIGRDDAGQPAIDRLECRANWKTMYENYSPNVYHESFVHEMYRNSEHSPRVDAAGRKTYGEVADERGFLGLFYDNSIAASFMGEMKSLPPVRLKDGKPSRTNSIVNMYPNWVITVLGNQARMSFMLPEGPDLCIQYIATFFDVSVFDAPERAADRKAARLAGVKAREEDNGICESIQRARRSPAVASQFFNSFWDKPHYVLTQMLLRLYLADHGER
jgi:choline monooxygenase